MMSHLKVVVGVLLAALCCGQSINMSASPNSTVEFDNTENQSAWSNLSLYHRNGSAGHYPPEVPHHELMFYYYLWTFVAPSIFAAITVVGTVGNSLVIYVIWSKISMQTVTNCLLMNLAFADISFLLICVPFTAYKYAADSWPFGDFTCKVVKYFLYVTTYVTIYTLVAVSALRFLTVVCNACTARFRTKRNILYLSVGIWVLMFGLHVPTLMAHKAKSYKGYSYCGINKYAVEPIFVTFFIFAYALPLVLICFLYILIMCHLRRASSGMIDQSRDRTSRACRMITLVIVVFGVSWLPLHINSLVAYYGQLPNGAYYEVFRILWNSLSYGNSCANPFIYNYVSSDFRKGFKEVFCCVKLRRSRQSDRGSLTETLTML